jgi:hypothetical protein
MRPGIRWLGSRQPPEFNLPHGLGSKISGWVPKNRETPS